MSQHFVIINNSKLLQSNISLFYGDIRYNISLLFIYFAHNSLHSLNRITFLDPLPPLSPLVITSLFFTFVSVLSYMFIYFSGSTYRWEDLLLKLHILKLLKVFEASFFLLPQYPYKQLVSALTKYPGAQVWQSWPLLPSSPSYLSWTMT